MQACCIDQSKPVSPNYMGRGEPEGELNGRMDSPGNIIG